MITKADDFPIHQISKPVAETGTERNFYDRYFFNGYSKDEDIYFGAVLCVYPNLNIMDGSFTLAYEGKQYNSRVSRYLNLERLDTKVGPLSVEVIEPLNKLKVTLADVENDLDVSIEFTSRFAPYERTPNATFQWTKNDYGYMQNDAARIMVWKNCS